MEKPYGNCDKNSESLTMCKMKCKIKKTSLKCGCIAAYMIDMIEGILT